MRCRASISDREGTRRMPESRFARLDGHHRYPIDSTIQAGTARRLRRSGLGATSAAAPCTGTRRRARTTGPAQPVQSARPSSAATAQHRVNRRAASLPPQPRLPCQRGWNNSRYALERFIASSPPQARSCRCGRRGRVQRVVDRPVSTASRSALAGDVALIV